MKSLLALCILAIVVLAGGRASAQANVIENQSTTLYVDAKAGSDSNSGAQSSPFKTIQAAVNKANSLNQQSVGVKVIVNSGVYREFVSIANYKTTGATLTLQAAVAGTAVISGSDVIQGWSVSGGIYTKGWTYPIASCAVPSGWPSTFPTIALRSEMFFVNGVPLTQVTTWADLRPGTFFLNTTYSVLHIYPPAGTDMSTAVVEAAVRPNTFSLINRTNVALRGLVFQHASDCMNTTGANVYNSNNVLIDSVQAKWNNWGGLGIYGSTNVTVQNSVANYNGGVGFPCQQNPERAVQFQRERLQQLARRHGRVLRLGYGRDQADVRAQRHRPEPLLL